MKTWDDYKNHVSAVNYEIAKDIKESEEIATIVSSMIEQRNTLQQFLLSNRLKKSNVIITYLISFP
ncbi:hypothetical protein [Bullifex sp.]|uniref:hypothetical protein n=1 Tax=Bullifex sp. TaxID=2815808 RepID=UPI002A82D5EF|nr:hypothetical protein [Bullifex sp.]MDY4066131.1 hypothetical protein [Bullifex sp.]